MEIIVGKRYRHYKGGEYIVQSIGRHTETLEEMVVYEAQYPSEYGNCAVWIRPKKMFEEFVILENGEEVPRFSLIN